MENSKYETSDLKAHNNKILIRLAIWTGIYLFTTVPAALGSEFLWESNRGLTLAAILLNLGAGIGMIIANIRQLKTLDELMQKIQLEAMGIALGVGIVGGLSFGLLDTEDVFRFDAKIGYVVLLIGVTYLVALLFGCRKFK